YNQMEVLWLQMCSFFFQAEDGIRDFHVTGVQTCALPISEPVKTLDGWYSLHDFRTIDWASWKLASPEERKEAIEEFTDIYNEWVEVEEKKEGSHAFYTIIGQKADFLFWLLRPTPE